MHPDSASVVCDTGRDLTRPASPYAAKFSLPWTVAALLIDGGLGLDTFAEQSIARPEVRALAARVTWDVTPSPATVAADAPGAGHHHPDRRPRITGNVSAARAAAGTRSSQEALIAKFEAQRWADPAAELVRAVTELDAAAELAGRSSARQPAAAGHPRRRRLRHGVASDQTRRVPLVPVRRASPSASG